MKLSGSTKISNLRDDLRALHRYHKRLPGTQLGNMIQYPAIYALDTLSAEIHVQVLRLQDIQKELLSSMEVDFLETFQSLYNY